MTEPSSSPTSDIVSGVPLLLLAIEMRFLCTYPTYLLRVRCRTRRRRWSRRASCLKGSNRRGSRKRLRSYERRQAAGLCPLPAWRRATADAGRARLGIRPPNRPPALRVRAAVHGESYGWEAQFLLGRPRTGSQRGFLSDEKGPGAGMSWNPAGSRYQMPATWVRGLIATNRSWSHPLR
jgi:hypothetical protein